MHRLDLNDLYHAMFFEETKEHIEKIEAKLLELEKDGQDSEIINDIFRMAHSIKGSSSTMGISDMTNLCHNLESLLSKVRDKELIIDCSIMNICFRSIDALKSIHSFLDSGKMYESDIDSIIKEIKSILDKSTTSIKKSSCSIKPDLELTQEEKNICRKINNSNHIYKITALFKCDTRMKSVVAFLVYNNLCGIGEIVCSQPNDLESAKEEEFSNCFSIIISTNREYDEVYNNVFSVEDIDKIFIKRVRECTRFKANIPHNIKIIDSKTDNSTIRINVNKIDRLLDFVGELVMDKEKLCNIAKYLERNYKHDAKVNELFELIPNIEDTITKLNDTVVSVRLTPLHHVFNRFPRMVRDLSLKYQKDIDFVIEDSDTEIDKGMIEELVDPLTHIIRNSIDHGIETSYERLQQNKPTKGIISVLARHESNNIIIEVSDDGRGIDIDYISKKALQKGLITEQEIQKLSRDERLQLLFLPGFSTAKSVSDISGRGVGLDVVKSNISRLSGAIDIQTELNKGTKFIISLPLTLSIVEALLVEYGEYIFAIPTVSVIEIFRLCDIDNKNYMNIPIIRFEECFKIKSDKLKYIATLGFCEKRVAILFERIISKQEIVLKPYKKYLNDKELSKNIKGISGVCTIADGRFAFVLDVNFFVGRR